MIVFQLVQFLAALATMRIARFFAMLLICYFFFNIIDLRLYDERAFLGLIFTNNCSLWELYELTNKPYRLKELVFDWRFVKAFFVKNYKKIPLILCATTLFSTFLTLYLAIAVFLTVVHSIWLISLIIVSKFYSLTAQITRRSRTYPINNLSSLSIFLFIDNPDICAFAIVYFLLKKRNFRKNHFERIFERILFNRLFGKSRWFISALICFTKLLLLEIRNPIWLRKKINWRNLRFAFFSFLNNFIEQNCTKISCLTVNCKILFVEGKLSLNMKKIVFSTLAAISGHFQKKTPVKPLLEETIVRVGGRAHDALGFRNSELNEFSAQAVKTTKPTFGTKAERFETVLINESAPFRYPLPTNALVPANPHELRNDLNSVNRPQYITYSHIVKNAVTPAPYNIVPIERLLQLQARALVHHAVNLLKNKFENVFLQERLLSLTTETFFDDENLKNLQILDLQIAQKYKLNESAEQPLYIVQSAKPSSSRLLPEIEIRAGISNYEKDFLFNANLLSVSIEESLAGGSTYEKLSTLEHVISTLEALTYEEFSVLMATGLVPELDASNISEQ